MPVTPPSMVNFTAPVRRHRSLSPETLGDSIDVAETQKTGLGGADPLPPKHLSPPEERHQPEAEAEAEAKAEADQGEESPPGERGGRSRVKDSEWGGSRGGRILNPSL